MTRGGPDARIAASLVDGERVLISRRPDLGAWLFDQWIHLVAVFVCGCVGWNAESSALSWAAAIAMVFLTAYLVARIWAVSWTRYVLTTHRAMRFSGVLRNDQEYMTWSKITDVSIERSIGDRLTRTATIRIHSANEKSSFKAMQDVARPLELADWISRMVSRRAGAVLVED